MEHVFTRARWEEVLTALEQIEGYEAQTCTHIIEEDIRIASHGRPGGLQNMSGRMLVAVWLPDALSSWISKRVLSSLPEAPKRRIRRRRRVS